MSRVKTILSGATISASGGTASGVMRTDGDTARLVVDGDSGAGNVTIDVTGVKLRDSATSFATLNTPISFANVDVTGRVAFSMDVAGYETVEVTVTNNATTGATINEAVMRTE